MKKLADISAFTNLMNQSNPTPVYNGFKDKAKRALIYGLIGSSLLGGGYYTGHKNGQTSGYKEGYNTGSTELKEGLERDYQDKKEGYRLAGWKEGYDRGWDDQYDASRIVLGDMDFERILKKLEEIPTMDEFYGRRGIDDAGWYKKRAKMLMYTLESNRGALTREQQIRLDQIKSKIRETGLIQDFDYDKNGDYDIFDRFDNPCYRRGR